MKISTRDNINRILELNEYFSYRVLDNVKDLQIFSQQFQPKFARTIIVSYLAGSQKGRRKGPGYPLKSFSNIFLKFFLLIFIHFFHSNSIQNCNLLRENLSFSFFFFCAQVSHVFSHFTVNFFH